MSRLDRYPRGKTRIILTISKELTGKAIRLAPRFANAAGFPREKPFETGYHHKGKAVRDSLMINRRLFLRQSTKLIELSLIACTANTNSTDSQSVLANIMKLESSAFSANGTIPAKYTCDGQDISPSLTWDEPPPGTQSFALIVDDPDAPGRTFVHWILYNLPAETRQLLEGIDSIGIQGKNDFGKLGYGGPCPPSGIHRYFFKLYALDTTVQLAAGSTKEQLLTAMDGHILGAAELIGRYSRR